MDDMLNEEEKNQIKNVMISALSDIAVTGIIGALATGLESLIATNIHKQKIQGNTILAPTNDETMLSDKKTSASEVDSSLASDEVAASNGSLNASEMEAAASTAETTASESGATAVRSKAGASDIEVKALKMT